VVANLPAPTLVDLGLDYDTLRGIRPDIVLTTVDAFGPGGPYSDRVGFDGVAQAMSGSVYLSGTDGEPRKAYAPWVDFMTASLAALGTVSALLQRRITGEGQHVQGALLWSAMTAMGGPLLAQEQLVDDPPVDSDSGADGDARIGQQRLDRLHGLARHDDEVMTAVHDQFSLRHGPVSSFVRITTRSPVRANAVSRPRCTELRQSVSNLLIKLTISRCPAGVPSPAGRAVQERRIAVIL